MEDHETGLSLDDLAQVVCEGNVEGELQERVAEALRTDPRCAGQFAELETMTAEAGAEDLWEGLERHQEFDRLQKAPAQQAVLVVAEALRHLSQRTADKVVAEVRREYCRKPQDD